MVATVLDIEDIARIREGSTPCSCTACAALCSNLPGGYDPQHLSELVRSGAISLTTDLVKDYLIGDGQEIHCYLRPPTVHEKPGELAPFFPRRGRCAMLTDTGCSLARADMPIGCVSALACDPTRSASVDKHEAPIVWGTPAGVDLIRQFDAANFSRDPNAPLDIATVRAQLDQFNRNPINAMMASMTMLLGRYE
jgi:hypothetical protein